MERGSERISAICTFLFTSLGPRNTRIFTLLYLLMKAEYSKANFAVRIKALILCGILLGVCCGAHRARCGFGRKKREGEGGGEGEQLSPILPLCVPPKSQDYTPLIPPCTPYPTLPPSLFLPPSPPPKHMPKTYLFPHSYMYSISVYLA